MSNVSIKLSLRARIGDVDFPDVLDFGGTWALNTIPRATLTVALGRDIENRQPATIHSAASVVRRDSPVKVWLTATVLDNDGAEPGVPDGVEVLLFEGKVAGPGLRRGVSEAAAVVALMHWTSEIDSGSAASASSHPGNPADLAFPAVFRAMGGAGVVEGGALQAAMPGWVPMVTPGSITPAALNDVWGQILHPWMVEIASQDPLDERLRGAAGGAGDPELLAALDRLKPNVEGKPLQLRLDDTLPNHVADGISQALLAETGQNWINTTLWGKLVGEWAPSYMFAVVPRTVDALIVPFVGPLRGAPWAVLGTDDVWGISLDMKVSSPLRGVGIVTPTMFMSGVGLDRGAILADNSGLAGYFGPSDTGRVLLKAPPAWLSDPVLPGQFTGDNQGLAGAPVGTDLDEEVGAAGDIQAVGAAQGAIRSVLDRFAQQWYAHDATQDRSGDVVGKLRLDIAPGSQVRLDVPGAVTIQGDVLNESLYGVVQQVAIVIDANNDPPKAATVLSLVHVRYAAENESDTTSTEGPPLYVEAWRGASLVPGLPPER